jgi:hypothetical protein
VLALEVLALTLALPEAMVALRELWARRRSTRRTQISSNQREHSVRVVKRRG